MNKGEKKLLILVLVIALVGILILLSTTTIPAGHVGVGNIFGDVDHNEFPQGLHLINPVMGITTMSIQTQSIKHTADILTKEGLSVNVEVTSWYHLDANEASDVYQNIGVYYKDKIVVPKIRSAIRSEVAKFNATAVYSEQRTQVEQAIFDEAYDDMKSKGIILEKVMIRNVKLPDQLMTAIEEKQAQREQIQKKQYEVEKQQLESERMRVEAQGIADANQIISESLDEKYLTWYWIKEGLQKGDVYYVPVGNTGLPLIKDISEE